MLYRLLWVIIRVVGVVHWRRISLVGVERLPRNKPVILAANHTNAFFDATLLASALPPGRRLRFLATAGVFQGRWMGAVLRNIGLLPVYRFRDGYGSLRQNDATFDACATVLQARGTALIFSEGQCHPVPQLKPLLKGTARLALRAAAEGAPDLVVVPLGINHSAHGHFRGDVSYVFGTPIPAAEWLTTAEADTGAANRGLTDVIHAQLRSLVVHLDDLSMQDALAEVTLMLPQGAPGWRRGDGRFTADRQDWAEALNDVQEGPALAARVRSLREERLAAGLRRVILPGSAAPSLFALLLVAPLALLGLLLAWPDRLSAEAMVRRTVKDPQFTDSMRAVYGMVLYGITSLLLSIAGLLLAWRAGWSAWALVAVVLLLPFVAGWLTVVGFRWRDRWLAWTDQRRWDGFERAQPDQATAMVGAWQDLATRLDSTNTAKESI